ncbi:hypothetical protein JCM5353_004717 [Sporobolomyces roseus]
MGCLPSSNAVDADYKRVSVEIDNMIKKSRKELKTVVKCLLLGPGESGKSTVVKQLRLAYSRPYSREERERFKEVVFTNTLQSMQAALFGFDAVGVSFPESRKTMAAFILSLSMDDAVDSTTSDFNPSVAKAIEALWAEPSTKEVVAQSSKFQLNDSATYFFDALPRTSQPDYLPIDSDILRTRIRSTGIVEEVFNLDQTRMVVVDVGGQRSERKKWIHCFESVHLLLFVAAISEYDQYLFEEETQLRMTETLMLWENISTSPWFRKTAFVLFLNKIDLLKEKILADPDSVQHFLPEYTGSPTDVDSVKMYLLSRFKALHRMQERVLFVHFTCATDTTAIRPILSAVMQAVVTASLTHLGIL